MPVNNRFRHQSYLAHPIGDRGAATGSDSNPQPGPAVEFLAAGAPVLPGSPLFHEQMRGVAERFRNHDVRLVLLVHGTFVGDDALGLIRKIGRVWPASAARLQLWHKHTLDVLARDAGNYTTEFASQLRDALNPDSSSPIDVQVFTWSGENHHIGRADGAIRLLETLASLDHVRGGRVQLWGHSHGGNVFALLTNLLAADRETRDEFFAAARPYYHSPLNDRVDVPRWLVVQDLLEREASPLRAFQLDLVTFGTPVRYGWDTAGYAQLLHFINHRPSLDADPPLRPDQAVFPPSAEDILLGAHGDCFQALGIAGTNLPPGAVSWRAAVADFRLRKLVQAGIETGGLLERLRLGLRAHNEGQTLLVDYGPAPGQVAGHAVYTRPDWIAFHCHQIASRFYKCGTGPAP